MLKIHREAQQQYVLVYQQCCSNLWMFEKNWTTQSLHKKLVLIFSSCVLKNPEGLLYMVLYTSIAKYNTMVP